MPQPVAERRAGDPYTPVMSDHHQPPPAAPVPTDLVAAARAFFPDLVAVEVIAGRDHLARVVTAEGAWRVRRWPVGSARARLAFVHRLLDRAGEAGVVVPAVAALGGAAGGERALASGGRLYDAQGWVPGRALGPSLPGSGPDGDPVHLPALLDEERFVAVAAAMARVHAATSDLPLAPETPVVPLAGVVGAVERAWSAQRARLRPIAPRTPLVQRWLAAGERALPAALAALARTMPEPEAGGAVVLHLGLWPAHVIAADEAAGEGGGALGWIGWEGAAAGSPLLDLAQIATRCRGWSAVNAELALAAYAAVRPLAPEERRLLPAVAALDLVAAAGHLLDTAFGPGRDAEAPTPTVLRAGAEALVASLETAAAVAAQGDGPRKPIARRWQHRTPAPPGGAAGPLRSPGRRSAPSERAGRGDGRSRHQAGRGGPRRPVEEDR